MCLFVQHEWRCKQLLFRLSGHTSQNVDIFFLGHVSYGSF